MNPRLEKRVKLLDLKPSGKKVSPEQRSDSTVIIQKSSVAEFKLPEYEGGLLFEASVAPGAFSISSWTAVVHQSEWEADIRENIFQERNWGKMQLGEKLKKGYFLGIDEIHRRDDHGNR